MAEYVTKEQVVDWFRPYGHMDESIPYEIMVSDLRGMPAADVAPVRPELRKAVELLHKNYEKALNSSYVRNPIAWALYHTWRETDEKTDGGAE